jgi:hypothetical protein
VEREEMEELEGVGHGERREDVEERNMRGRKKKVMKEIL